MLRSVLFLLAQVPVPLPVDTVPDVGTPLGNLYGVLWTALAVAVLAVLGVLGTFLAKKASTSTLWKVVDKVAHLAVTSASAVEAELRPSIVAALKDGTITPAERADIFNKALAVLKLQLGPANLEAIRKQLGLSDSGLESYLWGLAQSVISRLVGSGAASALVDVGRPANPPSVVVTRP